MANLQHILFDNDDPIFSYYITLCHVYYFHVSEENSEKDKQQAEATIETLSSLIFHAINIEGTTIREMDNEQYIKDYKRFYSDIMGAIQSCCKNEVDFDVFLEIIDEILGAAVRLATAFDKLKRINEDEQENVIESETDEGEEEVEHMDGEETTDN
jgi:glutamine synthetase type III